MLVGPDFSRCVQEFEAVLDSSSQSTAHYEEANFSQVKYRKDVVSYVDRVNQLGNPFLATGQQLVAWDTQKVVEQEIATSLSKIRELGQAKHADYILQILEKCTLTVSETIGRNKILTFANRPDSKKGRKASGVQKHGMALITQLFFHYSHVQMQI